MWSLSTVGLVISKVQWSSGKNLPPGAHLDNAPGGGIDCQLAAGSIGTLLRQGRWLFER